METIISPDHHQYLTEQRRTNAAQREMAEIGEELAAALRTGVTSIRRPITEFGPRELTQLHARFAAAGWELQTPGGWPTADGRGMMEFSLEPGARWKATERLKEMEAVAAARVAAWAGDEE